jgi:hypothetical protein
MNTRVDTLIYFNAFLEAVVVYHDEAHSSVRNDRRGPF